MKISRQPLKYSTQVEDKIHDKIAVPDPVGVHVLYWCWLLRVSDANGMGGNR